MLNKDLIISVPNYSYTTPTTLGSTIEKIMADVFLFNVFKRFLFCPRFLRFYVLRFLNFFLECFFIYEMNKLA